MPDRFCENDVVIFEEWHDSIEAQFGIALRLVRLYEQCNVRHVALEGATEENDLRTSWYHQTSDRKTQIQMVAQMLKKGEVSAAEYFSMVFPDVTLHPIETSEEHGFMPEYDYNKTIIQCLVRISLRSLSVENRREYANKLNKIEVLNEHLKKLIDKKDYERLDKVGEPLATLYFRKKNELEEATIYKNKTAQFLYQRLKDLHAQDDSDRTSTIEENLALLEEIEAASDFETLRQNRNSSLPKAFQMCYDFLKIASKRSETMVNNTSEVCRNFPGAPVAMIIGAAHTEKVRHLLSLQHRKHGLIPLSLLTKNKFENMTRLEYDRKERGFSVDNDRQLGAFLDNRKHEHKPMPSIDQPWLKAKAEVSAAIVTIANAPPSGGGGDQPPYWPYNLQSELDKLSLIQVDYDSFQVDENGEIVGKISVSLAQRYQVPLGVRAKKSDKLDILPDDIPIDAGAIEKTLLDAFKDFKAEAQIKSDKRKSIKDEIEEFYDDLETLFENRTLDEVKKEGFLKDLETTIEAEQYAEIARVRAAEAEAVNSEIMQLTENILATVTPFPDRQTESISSIMSRG